MLDRLEQSWLDQPYHRYYMQEDLRQTKMEYAQYNIAVLPPPHSQGESFSRTASFSAPSPSPLPISPKDSMSIGTLALEAFLSLKSKNQTS